MTKSGGVFSSRSGGHQKKGSFQAPLDLQPREGTLKKRIIACAVVLIFLGLKAAAQESGEAGIEEAGERTGVVQKITEMEQRVRDANLRNDASFFEQALADSYVAIGSRGNIYGKAAAIRVRESGYLKFHSIESSDQKVRVYGNTAIVTGTVDVGGSFKERHFGATYVYTRVYVKEGQDWRIVNFQVTKVVPFDLGNQ